MSRTAPAPDVAATESDPSPIRPSWRGWIHRVSFLVFVPLFGVLVVLAPTRGTRIAIIVYALGVSAMLGVSAVYHSGRLQPSTIAWMKRVDHSTILLAIAGSYTAIAVLALPTTTATDMLVYTWIAVAVGVAVRMLWLRAPYPVVATVYVAVGWGALLWWSAILDALTGTQLALLIAGGIFYTAGAAVYAVHRPNPWPASFGYHEIFHTLVVLGVAAHYLVVADLVVASR